jgi:hypothetical protein
MDTELGEMIADVQILPGAPDLEVAPGVQLGINPDHLAKPRLL